MAHLAISSDITPIIVLKHAFPDRDVLTGIDVCVNADITKHAPDDQAETEASSGKSRKGLPAEALAFNNSLIFDAHTGQQEALHAAIR